MVTLGIQCMYDEKVSQPYFSPYCISKSSPVCFILTLFSYHGTSTLKNPSLILKVAVLSLNLLEKIS